MKRILSIILIFIMVCSLAPLGAAAAETTSFSQDFADITVPEDQQSWFGIENNYEYIVNGYDVSGIGGKAETDKSIYITKESNSYYRRNVYPYGRTTIEYNILKLDTGYSYLGISGGNNGWMYLRSDKNAPAVWTATSGNVGTYKLGQWVHVAFDMNLGASEIDGLPAGKYDGYINGVKLVSQGTIPTQIYKEGENLQFRWMGKNYLDDIKIYSGSYDNSNTAAYLLSQNSAAVIDESSKTVTVPKLPASNVISKLSVSDGATLLGIVNPDTLKLRASDEVIETNDLVAIVAPDGMTYSYYTLTAKGVYYAEDFTGVTADGTDSAQNLGDATLINGISESGVGGKAPGDVSIKLEENDSYLSKTDIDFSSASRATIEYSMLKWEADSYNTLGVSDGTPFPIFRKYSGNDIVFGGQTIGTYELGKWYHIAIDMDITNATFDYYVNGECIKSDATLPTYYFGQNRTAPLRFTIGKGYVDDIKIYFEGYTAPSALDFAMTSGAKKDDNYYHVAFPETISVSGLKNYIDLSSGQSAYIVDSQTHMTKTEGNAEIGDLMAVCKSDGVTYIYYSIVSRVYEDFDMITCEVKSDGSTIDAADIASGDTVSFEYTVQNKTDNPKEGMLIFVAYEDDTLAYLDIQPISVDAGEIGKKFTSTANYTASSTPDLIEVYLWKSMTERTSLLGAYKLK